MNQVNGPEWEKEKIEVALGWIEEALKKTIEDRDIIQKKVLYLLGIYGAVITLSIGTITKGAKNVPDWVPPFCVAEALLCTGLALAILWRCFLPSGYAAPGANAPDVLNAGFLGQPIEKMLFAHGDNLGDRFATNLELCKKMGKDLRRFTMALFLSPLAAAMITLVWDYRCF